MKTRFAKFALTAVLLGSVAAPAVAQQRQPNARREQMKLEADKAYQSGDYKRTIELATDVLAADNRDHVAYYLRGSALVEIGIRERDVAQIRKGIADAREAIRLNNGPDKKGLYYIPYLYGMTHLARIENRPQHADVAVQVADQALAIQGIDGEEKANLYYQRAKAKEIAGKPEEAIEDYEAAIAQDERHLGSYIAIAEVTAAMGDVEAAIARFTKATEVFATNPLVFNNRGMYLKQQGRTAEAIADFTRAIEIDPKFFHAYTNRGFTFMEQGDAQAAESDYATSLKLNWNQPTVLNMRSAARLAQGKADEAIEDQMQVISLQPENPYAYGNLGFARFFAGNYREAVEAFAKANELKPDLRHVLPWRYASLELSKGADSAKKEVASKLQPDAEKRDWIDHVLAYMTGEIDADQLLNLVNTDDSSIRNDQVTEAHFFIGVMSRVKGDEAAASEHFEAALKTNARHLSAYRGAQFALKRFEVADARRR